MWMQRTLGFVLWGVAATLASRVHASVEGPVTFAPNPAGLTLFEQVPEAGEGPWPLVLLLHGCTQTASFAVEAGFSSLADELGVVLLVAEQSPLNEPWRCFRWFDPAQIAPLGGEAESLLAMIRSAQERYPIDDERVFVAGLSAGASMAAALLATQPSTFAGGALFAGVPYRCGLGLLASSCMAGLVTRTQAEWVALATDDVVETAAWPRVLVVQGESDLVVHPENAEQIMLQFTGLHGIAAVPSSTRAFPQGSSRRYGDAVEVQLFSTMGHGVPIDAEAGCGTLGPYALDVNYCGAFAAFEFLGLTRVAQDPRRADDEAAGTDESTPPADAGPAAGEEGVELEPGREPDPARGVPSPAPAPASDVDDAPSCATSRAGGHSPWGLAFLAIFLLAPQRERRRGYTSSSSASITAVLRAPSPAAHASS